MKDHCDFAPDKILGYDLSPACIEHDEYYIGSHYGKTKISRKEADLRFFNKIKEILPKVFIFTLVAWLYYIAVRWLGKKYWFNSKQ